MQVELEQKRETTSGLRRTIFDKTTNNALFSLSRGITCYALFFRAFLETDLDDWLDKLSNALQSAQHVLLHYTRDEPVAKTEADSARKPGG